jgi:hypothetical protein
MSGKQQHKAWEAHYSALVHQLRGQHQMIMDPTRVSQKSWCWQLYCDMQFVEKGTKANKQTSHSQLHDAADMEPALPVVVPVGQGLQGTAALKFVPSFKVHVVSKYSHTTVSQQ